jgi:hypothetical protein
VHLWVGIDAGKAHHHCVVIDADGKRLLSERVLNDEPALLQLLGSVLELAAGGPVAWATDLNHGGSALLIALIVGHGQTILYIPGPIVHHASKLYRGEGKRTRRTPPSSPTRPGQTVTCSLCEPVMRPARGCGSSPPAGPTKPP